MITRQKNANTGSTGISAISVTRYTEFPNIELLSYTKDGSTTIVTELLKGNGIVSGGLVNWIENLDFGVSSAAYVINGQLYISTANKLTLSPADVTNPRIDIIIVDSVGVTSVIEGVPAENPQKPTPDPETQIELTQILVPAGGTSPVSITGSLVYNEHVEWTGSASGVVVDFDSATSPFNGAKCIDVGQLTKGDTISFADGTVHSAQDFETLTTNIKLKAALDSSYFLTVQLKLNGINITNELRLPFVYGNATTWQTVIIKLNEFRWYGTGFNQVIFKWNKSGADTAYTGIYLDFIKFEKGLDQPTPTFIQPDWKQTDTTKPDYVKNKPDSPLSFDFTGMAADEFVILEEYTVHTANVIGIAVRCDAETAVINILLDSTTIKFNNTVDIPISNVRAVIDATADNAITVGKTIKLVYKSGAAGRIYGTLILRG